MKYSNATPQSRFLAYIIDYSIVDIISNFLLGFVIYPILKFDSSLLETKMTIFMENLSKNIIDYELVNQIFYLSFLTIGISLAVFIPIIIIYFCIIPMLWEKQTIGRLATNLKVVNVKDEGKVGFGWLFIREVLVGYILVNLLGSALVVPLVYTLYAAVSKGRSLADILGKTRLVNTKIVVVETVYNFKPNNTFEENYSSSVNENYSAEEKNINEKYSSDDEYMVI